MKIIPSILTNDPSDLENKLQICADLGVDEIQLDICDADFVKNKTIYIKENLEILKKYSSRFNIQTHLMVKNIYRHISEAMLIPASMVFFHFEAVRRIWVDKTLRNVVKKGMTAGIALSPETPVDSFKKYLCEKNLSTILILTVNPGFYGSEFLPENLEKITRLRELGFKGKIGVDGGVSDKTIDIIRKYNPDFVCCGGYILESEKPLVQLDKLA
ncbi:MAG: ribulose-phosphate 3-epimerase [Candidatus Berkelbacteria bacterium Licking1014_85]|uniref:Ribulose-phosphate 3-epimerase n=1 Tax=Candidatus Berkelbacteria bacterium Licking1014_85 TaxID=2017148 RepID=A0A554LMR4_9BACT|nr:MAG: ribulose-phosphate 3-epimerase [Candidatus Berkelbacteria bacterium Licking1014_85]